MPEEDMEHSQECRGMRLVREAHPIGPVAHFTGAHHGDICSVIRGVEINASKDHLVGLCSSPHPVGDRTDCQNDNCSNCEPGHVVYMRRVFHGALLVYRYSLRSSQVSADSSVNA